MTEVHTRIARRFPAFQALRTFPWEPGFQWVRTAREAAGIINLPHEDYPQRVPETSQAITAMAQRATGMPHNVECLQIHQAIFPSLPSSGRWRDTNVMVVFHRPPDHRLLPKLMEELELVYQEEESSVPILEKWYLDFETIHPFLDGNGRVGGAMVAALSHALEPDRGYLAPER